MLMMVLMASTALPDRAADSSCNKDTHPHIGLLRHWDISLSGPRYWTFWLWHWTSSSQYWSIVEKPNHTGQTIAVWQSETCRLLRKRDEDGGLELSVIPYWIFIGRGFQLKFSTFCTGWLWRVEQKLKRWNAESCPLGNFRWNVKKTCPSLRLLSIFL